MKSLACTYVLWLFLGIFGVHRFYLGGAQNVILGIVYLFTGGLFLIGWIVDAFLIPGLVKDRNLRDEERNWNAEKKAEKKIRKEIRAEEKGNVMA